MAKVLRAVAGLVLMVAPVHAALAVTPAEQPVPQVQLQKPKPGAPAKPSVETVSRGELLHENHCTGCHESIVHIRSDRRAKSLKELEGWVIRWADQQQLGWGPDEITDVVDYLNRRYYKFKPIAR